MTPQPSKSPQIFDWDRYRKYVTSMTGAEEELIRRHFEQVRDGNDWDELGLSSPEAQDRFSSFKMAWILARMFTDDKLKPEGLL